MPGLISEQSACQEAACGALAALRAGGTPWEVSVVHGGGQNLPTRQEGVGSFRGKPEDDDGCPEVEDH